MCAMAETLYSQKKEGLCAAAVGGVTVRYEKGRPLRRQLMEQAAIYLDIYRGVTVCNVH